MLFSRASMQRHEECQRLVRSALKKANEAHGDAARQCWVEIADQWASLAAQWLEMQARFQGANRNPDPYAYDAE